MVLYSVSLGKEKAIAVPQASLVQRNAHNFLDELSLGNKKSSDGSSRFGATEGRGATNDRGCHDLSSVERVMIRFLSRLRGVLE
jgi:hypothetical protein